MASFTLNGTPDRIPTDAHGSYVQAPGLTGEGESDSSPGLKLVALTKEPEFHRALELNSATLDQSIDLKVIPSALSSTIYTETKTIRFHYQPPQGEAGWGAILRVTHEKGHVTWHLPVQKPQLQTLMRLSVGGWDFDIPNIPVDQEIPMGFMGSIGKKIIDVVKFKLLQGATDFLITEIAGRVERAVVKEGLIHLWDGGLPPPQKPTGVKVLLFVHGIFSSTNKAFSDVIADRARMTEISRSYNEVLGFDHRTVTDSPVSNAAALIQMLGNKFNGQKVELDVVSHSRGGLVSRSLIERYPPDTSVTMDRLVMVGTPNGGTPLADGGNLEQLINISSVALNLFVTPELQPLVVAILKLAVHGITSLPGIQAMSPTSDFLTSLNVAPNGGQSRYYIARADFIPSDAWKRILNALWGTAIFGGQPNDLFVPFHSVESCDSDQLFSGEMPFRGGTISHCTFFADSGLRARIGAWLGVTPGMRSITFRVEPGPSGTR